MAFNRVSLVVVLLCAACGVESDPSPIVEADAGADSGAEQVDAGEGRGTLDAGAGVDAGPSFDAGRDAGSVTTDAGVLPAGDGGLIDIGVNLSGLEFSSAVPGKANTDYAVPTTAELDYFAAKRLTLLRLPFKWDRLQPVLNGPLDSAYLGLIKQFVADAHARGTRVILDVHNYGGYGGSKIGAGTVTKAHFADLWRRLATEFVGVAGIAGYDLMNEPSGMPNKTAWPEAAQAAVDAIRQVDTQTELYVEGDGWSAAPQWVTNNASLHIDDPSDKVIYSAHCYLDRDNSGTHFTWADEVAAGVTTDTGRRRISVFVGWLKEHGYRGHIGEIGAGNNDPGWLEALDKTLDYCQANGLRVTYWTAGPWWGNYPYSIEPQAGRDARQMAVISRYSGAAQPTTYASVGPTRARARAVSAPFSIEYRGRLSSPVTIRPSDGGAGGQFTPASAVLPAGFNGVASFTYVPSKEGTVSVSFTNTAGWQDPPAQSVTVSAELFAGAAAAPANVFSLRKLRSAYTGPCVKLRRSSDQTLADFGFTNSGDLDTAAITTWAGGSEVFVVTWYDQSGAAHDAVPVFSDNKGGGDATAADQPRLVLNARNGHPIIRFNNSRMDAVSPIASLSGQTIMSCFKPESVAKSQRLLSWQFTSFDLFPNGDGQWALTNDPTPLSLSIDSTSWHTYSGRWRAATAVNGKQVFRDGVVVGESSTTANGLSFPSRSNVNIGWFRWAPGLTFGGDVAELLLFSGALADGDLEVFQASMKAYWGTP